LGEISVAGREQSKGVTQINSAVSQLSQVVQSNAATAEEAAAASEELSAQAESMNTAVRDLVRVINGNRSAETGVNALFHAHASGNGHAAIVSQPAFSGGYGHSLRDAIRKDLEIPPGESISDAQGIGSKLQFRNLR
jgi:methyl-accepting chemotaxis protein